MDKVYQLARENIRQDETWSTKYLPIYRVLITRDNTRRVVILRAHDGTWDSFYVNRYGDIKEFLGYCNGFNAEPLGQVTKWIRENA